jgi:hypothetical protein
MNENCPVKASNLKNPSQCFQEVSGLNFNIPCNTHEFFHFNDLPATIQTKHHAASAHMRQLGFTPIDDFTFLHLPPTGTTTSTNIVSPLHTLSVVNTNCNDSATANSMSILTNTAVDGTISSHASHLNLNTQPNSTNKRARSTSLQSSMADPTTQYILLSAPVNEPFSTTHNNLQNTLTNANLPTSLLSLPLLAWVPPSALHVNENWFLSNSTILLFQLQSYYLFHNFLPRSPRHQKLMRLTSLLIPAPPSNASAASLLALTTMTAMTSSQMMKPAFSTLSFMAITSTNPFSYHSHPASSCPLVGAGAVTSALPYSSPLAANATISPHAPISPPHS